MELQWQIGAWEDYTYWQQTDKKTLLRVNELIRDALRHPYSGIGKPEPLKGQLRGYWSRRITQEHRLIYRVVKTDEDEVVVIVQCRYHY